MKSKGNFIGREVLEDQKTNGANRKLCTFITTENLPLTGGETILLGDDVVSLATLVAFGHSVGRTIMRGYLYKEHWEIAEFTLEVFGVLHRITQIDGPVYDPQNNALKE